MSVCLACRGIGCSACQRTYQLGRITLDPSPVTHTCPNCMRGLPCGPSLSAAVGQVVAASNRYRSEVDWKRDSFGSWDANGSEVQ